MELKIGAQELAKQLRASRTRGPSRPFTAR